MFPHDKPIKAKGDHKTTATKSSLVPEAKATLLPPSEATGRVTNKADVYSFGVILMELIAGRKVLDDNLPEERTHLVTWFKRVMINKDNMLKALDPTLNPEDYTFVSISKVAKLAGHCTACDPFQRPDMGHAVNICPL